MPLWMCSLLCFAAFVAGAAATIAYGARYRRREAVDVDLTGRHPDRVDLDWQEPHGRVPLQLRTSNVASPAELARRCREQSNIEPKDAA